MGSVLINYTLTPTKDLNGEIRVPGDKSISHRALILAAIAEGRSQINGFLMGADNLATLTALQQMGVDIVCIEDENIVVVNGVGLYGLQAPVEKLNLGNSGTGLRLMAGLLAGQSFDSVLTGDPSLCRRPMGRVIDPLSLMGAIITGEKEGTPPLTITGGQSLKGIDYTLPMASAQVKSCLLLAGLYAKGDVVITEPAPSRDHTERMMQAYGCSLKVNKHQITLSAGNPLKAIDIAVPADISSAAFFMVAAAITPGSSLVLRHVGMNPTRKGIVNILKKMGAVIEIISTSEEAGESIADIRVSYSALHGIEIPEDQVPLAIDEFPVLFIAAACAKGTTTLRGAKELRVKETDRIHAMAVGLQQLGIQVKVLDDGIIIEGGLLQGGEVDSEGDHRIAMAFSVAGCVAADKVVVRNCKNVETSFPNFVELASEVGFRLED